MPIGLCLWASDVAASKREVYLDVPVVFIANQSATSSAINPGIGIGMSTWLGEPGGWRYLFGASIAYLYYAQGGTDLVHARPWVIDLQGHALWGYEFAGSLVSFRPHLLTSLSADVGATYKQVYDSSSWTPYLNVSAFIGAGIDVQIGSVLFRINTAPGYGIHGPSWKTTTSIGIFLF